MLGLAPFCHHARRSCDFWGVPQADPPAGGLPPGHRLYGCEPCGAVEEAREEEARQQRWDHHGEAERKLRRWK